MSKFEVITRSQHEHVYWVEADSFVEACKLSNLKTAYTSDCLQKTHMDEVVVAQTRLDEDADFVEWLETKRKQGYLCLN